MKKWSWLCDHQAMYRDGPAGNIESTQFAGDLPDSDSAQLTTKILSGSFTLVIFNFCILFTRSWSFERNALCTQFIKWLFCHFCLVSLFFSWSLYYAFLFDFKTESAPWKGIYFLYIWSANFVVNLLKIEIHSSVVTCNTLGVGFKIKPFNVNLILWHHSVTLQCFLVLKKEHEL